MSPEFSVWPVAVLRGQRDYYHSTDLYAELVAALKANGVNASSFDLKVRDKITTQPRVDFYRTESPDTTERPAAIAKFGTPNGDWVACVSNGLDPILARKPYDESLVWSKIIRKGTCFEVSDCEGLSPIELITSLGVSAHKSLYPPLAGERWFLAQIVASRLLGSTDLEYSKVDVARQIGPKLTQSNLIDKKGIFGKMLFILK